jgi:hypothetical protein
MRAGCPAPSWIRLWYWRRILKNFSGIRPRVSVSKTCFKYRAWLELITPRYRRSRGTVWHRPTPVRLWSDISVVTVGAWWGALLHLPPSRLFRPHLLLSSWFAAPLVRLSIDSLSPFGPSFRFPCVCLRLFFSFPAAVVVFYVFPVEVVTTVMAWLPTAPSRRLPFVSSPDWGRSATQNNLAHVLRGSGY